MRQYSCDVLIVGSGGAALRAALAIMDKDPKAKVILATKGKLGKSGVTANARSDRMAFHVSLPSTEPVGEDNWRYHADDIYRTGGYVSDEDLAQILAKNSCEAFEYLDSLGVPWVRKEDGRPDQFLTDGSRYPRACYTGPYTANHIEEALVKRIRTLPVKVLEDFMVFDLALSSSKDRVTGAFGLKDEELALIKARATILATGGAGEAFKVNVYPEGMTGDGYAMAYRAGAELVNMEFIQIGLSSVKTKLACSGSMMRAIPRFVNDMGEEFLPKYFPANMSLDKIYLTIFQKGASWPVSFEHKSHLIDIAVYRQLRKGRKVYLDYTCNPRRLRWEKMEKVLNWYRKIKGVDLLKSKELKERPFLRLKAINPEVISYLKERGVDLERKDMVEIEPAAQHFQGGIRIRERAQTSLKGLYAAGECAGGQHGANRPGGNALLDCQVFGKIAGLNALKEARTNSTSFDFDLDCSRRIREKLSSLEDKTRGEKASLVRSRVQDLLFLYASIIRTEDGLNKGLEELKEIERTGLHADERGLGFALETLNLLKVAQMIMGAARMRRESRGPHLYFRRFEDPEPLPRDDNLWQKYIIIRKGKENMEFILKKPVSFH